MRRVPTSEADRLRVEAANLDRRAEEKADENPTYAAHLERRADHCRWLARDADNESGGEG
ncbi:MAG TPA: hypothetical protein VD866_32260 [Urbifossiella sp.]|nr:hypothetical protein [Urbifossiella sp.]